MCGRAALGGELDRQRGEARPVDPSAAGVAVGEHGAPRERLDVQPEAPARVPARASPPNPCPSISRRPVMTRPPGARCNRR